MPALLYACIIWATVSYVQNEVMYKQLGMLTVEEKILHYVNNFYKHMRSNMNKLIMNTVKYSIMKIRSRRQPRDILLLKPLSHRRPKNQDEAEV